MKKILHLLSSHHFSGAENVVCQIVNLFREDNDVEMVYVSPDGQIRDALTERNVRFSPISEMSLREVRRIIQEEEPDVVYAHDMRASLFAALACKKTLLISHIHNNAFDSRKTSLKSIAYLFAAHKAKHIFWVSQSSLEGYAFRNFIAKKSSVLNNIIDIDALYKKMELDENKYDYDVVYVGRLTYPKNPQRLIDVFSLLCDRIPTAKVAIVGNGELEEETKQLAQEHNLMSNLSFLGFQSNPLKIMKDSKVMIMTSRWEGTPMCALEAMALGVPIVSTPTDGLRVLVKHGITGYLSDSDEELANYIVSLIENQQRQHDMSNMSLEVAKDINDKTEYKKAILQALNG